MPSRIQLRRDTTANWTAQNPTLLLGEIGIDTDLDAHKIGDGSTAWISLPWAARAPSGDIGDVIGASSNVTAGSTITVNAAALASKAALQYVVNAGTASSGVTIAFSGATVSTGEITKRLLLSTSLGGTVPITWTGVTVHAGAPRAIPANGAAEVVARTRDGGTTWAVYGDELDSPMYGVPVFVTGATWSPSSAIRCGSTVYLDAAPSGGVVAITLPTTAAHGFAAGWWCDVIVRSTGGATLAVTAPATMAGGIAAGTAVAQDVALKLRVGATDSWRVTYEAVPGGQATSGELTATSPSPVPKLLSVAQVRTIAETYGGGGSSAASSDVMGIGAAPEMGITMISSGGLYSDESGYTAGPTGTIKKTIDLLKKEGFSAVTIRVIWPQMVQALPNPSPVLDSGCIAKMQEWMTRCKAAGMKLCIDFHTLVVDSSQQSGQAPKWLHHIAPQTAGSVTLSVTAGDHTSVPDPSISDASAAKITVTTTGLNLFTSSTYDQNIILMQNSDPSTGGVFRVISRNSDTSAECRVEQAATSATWSSGTWYHTRRHVLDIFISSTSTNPRKDAVRNSYRDYVIAVVNALKTHAAWDIVDWVSPFNEIWLDWDDALSPERFTSGAKPTYQALRAAISTKLAIKMVPEWTFWSTEANKKYQIDEFIDLIDVYGVHPYWGGLVTSYPTAYNGAWDDARSVGVADSGVKYLATLRRMAADLASRGKRYEWTECGTNNSVAAVRNRHLYETCMRALTPGIMPFRVIPWVGDIGGGDSAFQTGAVQTFNAFATSTTFATGWLENMVHPLRGAPVSQPVIPITAAGNIDRRYTRWPVPITLSAAATLKVLKGRFRSNDVCEFVNNTPQHVITLQPDDFNGTGGATSCNLYRSYYAGSAVPIVRTAAYGTGVTTLTTTARRFWLRADDGDNIELLVERETSPLASIITSITNDAAASRVAVVHPCVLLPDIAGAVGWCDTSPGGNATVSNWEVVAGGSGYSNATGVALSGFLAADLTTSGVTAPTVNTTTSGGAITAAAVNVGGAFVHAPPGFQCAVPGGTGGIIRASNAGAHAIDKTVRCTLWAYLPDGSSGSCGCVQVGSNGVGIFTTAFTSDFGTPTYLPWQSFPPGTQFVLRQTRVAGSYTNLRYTLLMVR